MRGWIAINREFLKWKWFREPEMLSLFIYLLLKVNFAKADINGVMIDAGELLTSVAAITEATGLTTKQVRYRLSKLKRDKEITLPSTPQGSLIKLCTYNQYNQGAKVCKGEKLSQPISDRLGKRFGKRLGNRFGKQIGKRFGKYIGKQ